MSRIQSSIGLVSGIQIEDTVNKLLEVAARPRQLLQQRNTLLQAESVAVDQLASLVLALEFDAKAINSSSLYNARSASSSDTDSLTAAVIGGSSPPVGSYLFTPVQTASAQQLLSQSFVTDDPVGEGSFSFRTGGFVDQGVALDALNGGTGIQRGEIRITDRSGTNAVIDLRFARTVDDVLKAINSNTTINVTAEAVGDTFRITDNTSQTTSNLIVQEVSGGTTAASLGLSGINVAADTATGTDVYALHTGTKLTALNDNNGVRLIEDADDLDITFIDDSTLSVDLSGATTIGDVLDTLNTADPARISAAISSDGNRIELTDLTSGSGTFSVANVGAGTAADDLGLTTTAVSDTITGERLISGLRDVLVSSLTGGQGLGTLGDVDITNRDGVSFTVDLSAEKTLGGIVDAFNAQSTDVTATINSARSGIVLTDETGGSASNFIVADGDGNNSATALGIVVDSTATSINSGSLGRQIVSEATLLANLNQGAGVTLGDLLITDSDGEVAVVDLDVTDDEAETVGDVIDAINAAGIGVLARINDTGDGILLVDTVEGSGTLTVAESGSGTTAAELGLLGSAVEVDSTFVIDGTSSTTVDIDAFDTLADVVEKINALEAGVKASIVNDGVGQRLSLITESTGAANELQLDTSGTTLDLQQIGAARDGLLVYGSLENAGSGILISSQSNTYLGVVDGLNLTLKEGSQESVVVNVSSSTTGLVKAANAFVDAFNSLRTNIEGVTNYNETDQTTGVLFGSGSVLRVETDINRLFTSRFFGVGDIQSLGTLGFDFDDEGKLSLDSVKFQSAFTDDPEAVEEFFADEELGFVAKLTTITQRLAGDEFSALGTRGSTLADKIAANEARIESLNEQLERQRERLLLQFYQLETIIAEFQSNSSALANFTPVPPLVSTSS